MKWLFQIAGISKQAFYKKVNHPVIDNSLKIAALISEADAIRKEHPGCGVDKIYDTIKPDWIGKVNGVALLYSYGFKLNQKVNYKRTTIPVSSHYQNLIEGMLVSDKNQIWQSDITYIKIADRFYYLVFIIDVYTKQIIGYSISDNLKAEANLKALNMAFKSQKKCTLLNLIHHSDRGSQYVDERYLTQLEAKSIWISMGNKAQDNAYAERLNGIIKNEYLRKWVIVDFKNLKKKTEQAIEHYNSKRIHRHLPKKQSPEQFVKSYINLNIQNRPKVIIYTDGKPKLKSALSRLKFYPETEPQAPICPMVYI
jgi:putative transposase